MKQLFEIAVLKKILGLFRYGKHIRPVRDWFVLLSIMVIALAGSVAYNVWLLVQVQQGEAIGEVVVPVTSFNKAPLEAVQRVFDTRKEEETRIKTQYRFVDPSVSGS